MRLKAAAEEASSMIVVAEHDRSRVVDSDDDDDEDDLKGSAADPRRHGRRTVDRSTPATEKKMTAPKKTVATKTRQKKKTVENASHPLNPFIEFRRSMQSYVLGELRDNGVSMNSFDASKIMGDIWKANPEVQNFFKEKFRRKKEKQAMQKRKGKLQSPAVSEEKPAESEGMDSTMKAALAEVAASKILDQILGEKIKRVKKPRAAVASKQKNTKPAGGRKRQQRRKVVKDDPEYFQRVPMSAFSFPPKRTRERKGGFKSYYEDPIETASSPSEVDDVMDIEEIAAGVNDDKVSNASSSIGALFADGMSLNDATSIPTDVDEVMLTQVNVDGRAPCIQDQLSFMNYTLTQVGQSIQDYSADLNSLFLGKPYSPRMLLSPSDILNNDSLFFADSMVANTPFMSNPMDLLNPAIDLSEFVSMLEPPTIHKIDSQQSIMFSFPISQTGGDNSVTNREIATVSDLDATLSPMSPETFCKRFLGYNETSKETGAKNHFIVTSDQGPVAAPQSTSTTTRKKPSLALDTGFTRLAPPKLSAFAFLTDRSPVGRNTPSFNVVVTPRTSRGGEFHAFGDGPKSARLLFGGGQVLTAKAAASSPVLFETGQMSPIVI